MKNDPLYLDRARELRKTMTRHERKLWYDFLRELPVKFYKQKLFGRYILDFYCPQYSLAIELDGGQHFEEHGLEYDQNRDAYLEQKGIRMLRVSNADIDNNFRGVCEKILLEIEREV